MTLGKIITLEDRVKKPMQVWIVEWVAKVHGEDVAQQCAPLVASSAFGMMAIEVEVRQGRWVVLCPTCGGGQLASRAHQRFFCTDCLNSKIGGLWAMVAWPSTETTQRIQDILMRRPNPMNRNWFPRETIDELVSENNRNGIPTQEAA